MGKTGSENKRLRVLCCALVICITGWVVFALASEEVSAVSTKAKCEVYKTSPSELVLSPGEKCSVKKVNRYTLTIKDLHTFEDLKSLIKALSGKTCQASAFKWVSGNDRVARVSSSGKVTGVSKGRTYIYPVPRNVYSYKKKGKYILYTDVNFLEGFKVRGAFATRVTVVK